MSDGAHLGLGAEQALGAVMSGDVPAEPERMGWAEMREMLLRSTLEEPLTYESSANYAGRLVLEHLLATPADASLEEHELYVKIKALRPELGELGLTGFQWGWALNAARRCVELGPVPNPAIVEL